MISGRFVCILNWWFCLGRGCVCPHIFHVSYLIVSGLIEHRDERGITFVQSRWPTRRLFSCRLRRSAKLTKCTRYRESIELPLPEYHITAIFKRLARSGDVPSSEITQGLGVTTLNQKAFNYSETIHLMIPTEMSNFVCVRVMFGLRAFTAIGSSFILVFFYNLVVRLVLHLCILSILL